MKRWANIFVVILITALGVAVFYFEMNAKEETLSSDDDTPILKKVIEREKIAAEEPDAGADIKTPEERYIAEKERARLKKMETDQSFEEREEIYH